LKIDDAKFEGKSYVVINDYFSRWQEVEEMKGKTISDVI